MGLTDSEIIELETLLHDQEIFERRKSLLDFKTDKNKNYTLLTESLFEQKYEGDHIVCGYAGVSLAGSSRSGKTYSGVDFIIYLCLHVEKACTINIYRETYASFKDTLYDDFKKRLDYYDLDNPFHNAKEVKSFKIGKNKITFIGCDKISKAHGAGCDYAFFNEIMHIPQDLFNQVEMRCRKFWWADYNPSFTDHWFFKNVLNRPDVHEMRSTFKDNKHISKAEKRKILSYEPWLPDSYYIENNILMYEGKEITEKYQPPPHPVNVDNGTADEFMWKVYGLGLRGAMKGLIFPNVTWIDEFPNIAFTYGLDFGFVSDPSALVKYARRGKNIYLQLLWYASTETADEMNDALRFCKVSKITPITADSSDKYTSERKGTVQMVRELFAKGWEIAKVSKTKGNTFWLSDMKGYKIHLVMDLSTAHGREMYKAMKTEQENYRWKEIQGILINQPEDKYNHFFDGGKYGHMAHGQEL